MFAVNNVPVAVYRVWALGASEVRFTVAGARAGVAPGIRPRPGTDV